MKKFTIVEITDWEEDRHMEAGDSCHIPMSDVLFKEATERREKVEEGKWPNLPFTCEAENEDEAIEKYNEANCEYDYFKAVDAEFEEGVEEKKLVEAAIKGSVMEGAEISFYEVIGEGEDEEVWFILRKPDFNPKWLYFEAMVKGGKVLFGLHGNIGWEGESTDPNETYRKMIEIGEDAE